VVRILRNEGFEIFEAASGTEALRVAASQQPDLLVLDVKMPDMLGFEVTQRLRADPATSHIGIMHLSATFTDADALEQGLGAGADAYLTHPVEPRVLIAAVRALLRIQQYEAQLVDLLEREQIAREEAEQALKAAERVEQALQLSQRRLVRLSESGIIGLAYWDRNGNVTDANETFLNLTGHTRDESRSGDLRLASLIPPQWSDSLRTIMEEIRIQGVSAKHEIQILRLNGMLCDVLMACASLEDGKGLVFVMDITDRKRTEIERTRLFQELEESLRARDEFLAMATHDLRSPLGALQLKLDLLAQMSSLKDSLSAEDVQRHIGAAKSQLAQVTELLDKLLDTTRIRFGQVPIQWETVDLRQVVRETADRMREQARAHGSELTIEVAEGVTGTWDHIRLEQVLTNLVSNAIKYGAGSPIIIRVKGDSQNARLEVSDRGPGITPEDQARMFSAFERGHSQSEKGFGLGLWIVRRIVDALGGQIWVQSGSGQGSTFTMTLPRQRMGEEGRGKREE
jgi:PAS domain S-box-containing protein